MEERQVELYSPVHQLKGGDRGGEVVLLTERILCYEKVSSWPEFVVFIY